MALTMRAAAIGLLFAASLAVLAAGERHDENKPTFSVGGGDVAVAVPEDRLLDASEACEALKLVDYAGTFDCDAWLAQRDAVTVEDFIEEAEVLERRGSGLKMCVCHEVRTRGKDIVGVQLWVDDHAMAGLEQAAAKPRGPETCVRRLDAPHEACIAVPCRCAACLRFGSAFCMSFDTPLSTCTSGCYTSSTCNSCRNNCYCSDGCSACPPGSSTCQCDNAPCSETEGARCGGACASCTHDCECGGGCLACKDNCFCGQIGALFCDRACFTGTDLLECSTACYTAGECTSCTSGCACSRCPSCEDACSCGL